MSLLEVFFGLMIIKILVPISNLLFTFVYHWPQADRSCFDKSSNKERVRHNTLKNCVFRLILYVLK